MPLHVAQVVGKLEVGVFPAVVGCTDLRGETSRDDENVPAFVNPRERNDVFRARPGRADRQVAAGSKQIAPLTPEL